MEMSVVNKVTIGRITKDKDEKTKQMICRIKDKAYVAPENDKWRHDDSNSDNEDSKMNEMVEKKTRWWHVRDGKRKRTPKSSPAVVIPKEGEKGSSGEPQQKLIDETVLEPSVVIEQGADLLKQSLESYLKKNEEIAAQQAQGTSVHAEKVTRVQPETEALRSSSDGDSEATQSESELIPETVGKGKVQLKKRPSKKQKGSDEEDSPYDPEKSKRQRKKRKAAPVGIIPRNVRSKKSGAETQKDKEGKAAQHVQKEKSPSVDVPKEPEVKTKEVPVVVTKEKTDDEVEITGFRAASPKPAQQDIPESSHQKVEDFKFDFDNIGPVTGIFSEDMPEGESDMFNDQAVKELIKKVKEVEKEKAKAEEERDMLKSQINDLMEAHNKIVAALVEKEKRMNQMKDDVEGNSKVFDSLTQEISSLNAKIKDLENANQTLNQLLNEISEASSNEMKAMKLEMEAMKADKVMKDQQLQMLVAVVESYLKMNIHVAFDEIDVMRANERRLECERQMAEEANLKNKGIVEEVEIIDASSSQPEVGGSSSQPDVEMIEVVEPVEDDQEMVDAEEPHEPEFVIPDVEMIEVVEPVEDDQEMVDAEEPHEPEFVIVSEPSEPVIVENILRRVEIIQRRRRAREVLLLEYTTDKFVLIGNAYPVPYNSKEVAKLLKFLDRKRKGRIARGEIVDEDSDKELFGDDEEEDDGNDQGASGLLIRETNVQERVDELMNNEINEQEDEVEYEASSSGKQPVDQVLLSNPTVIYLSGKQQGEVEVRRTRAEMLEELGLEDGKFKFDIEDEIPHSPAKDFEPRYPHEADHYDDVIVESASDSEEDRVDFHYEGEDVAFPTFTELFQEKNEDELRRKIEERVSTADIPEPVPREITAEERKRWFKNMPKERKTLRALQYFTHNKDLSWGDILSWGDLEDLKVSAIRREQGVQYFEFLADITTSPWWDVDEFVVTKNIKQYYYGPEVRERDQDLWNYIKWQAKNNYPDWKPQYPKQIVTYLESGEKDITLGVKPPRCLKNMPLRAIEQDFYDLFQAWLYNPSTAEAVISLYDKTTGEGRRISILDPMWLVNCSKKDIDCLFVNKIIYDKKDKEIAMQYQGVIDVCFAKEINSGRN
ncbi:putative transcription factor bZIP family [Helianthus annuus]|nr:putative transcription factor bZIP family [Helianthus annuus]